MVEQGHTGQHEAVAAGAGHGAITLRSTIKIAAAPIHCLLKRYPSRHSAISMSPHFGCPYIKLRQCMAHAFVTSSQRSSGMGSQLDFKSVVTDGLLWLEQIYQLRDSSITWYSIADAFVRTFTMRLHPCDVWR